MTIAPLQFPNPPRLPLECTLLLECPSKSAILLGKPMEALEANYWHLRDEKNQNLLRKYVPSLLPYAMGNIGGGKLG